uniref:Helix-turn-helix domain protein n=1 Tax=Myoviridae sp. ctkOm7 TaxID=2826690 RepID=A0A8S5NN68_9CAUD|nr:MAG TPA: helix-turn-helix domain protein [Myoviridae sp. ctkOm7]
MKKCEPLAVTMTQAAQLLNVSRPTLYRLAKTPEHFGGCTRVLVDDLREWTQQQIREDA